MPCRGIRSRRSIGEHERSPRKVRGRQVGGRFRRRRARAACGVYQYEDEADDTTPGERIQRALPKDDPGKFLDRR